MKKLTCLLLSFIIFSTQLLAQNPCEDKLYIELKNQLLLDETKIETMTQREYEYFMQSDKTCKEYELSRPQVKTTEENIAPKNDYTWLIGMALILILLNYLEYRNTQDDIHETIYH